MIAGYFHEGSGLGNQLHRYIATRCLALDKGYEFGMRNPELFKGASFLNLDMGKPVEGIEHEFQEQKVENHEKWDVRGYDPKVLEVKDNTVIDGEFQDPKYFMHHIDEIRDWLKVKPLEMPDDLCLIYIRGGEYKYVPSVFLPKEYFEKAINIMKSKGITRFRVVSDDPEVAKRYFPEYEFIDDFENHDMGRDWRMARYAKWLILPNSSFAIFPALLNQDAKLIIAPKFWAGYNKGYWQLESNQYPQFTYIHHML